MDRRGFGKFTPLFQFLEESNPLGAFCPLRASNKESPWNVHRSGLHSMGISLLYLSNKGYMNGIKPTLE